MNFENLTTVASLYEHEEEALIEWLQNGPDENVLCPFHEVRKQLIAEGDKGEQQDLCLHCWGLLCDLRKMRMDRRHEVTDIVCPTQLWKLEVVHQVLNQSFIDYYGEAP